MAKPAAMAADLDEAREGFSEEQNINVEALALNVEETRDFF